MIEQRLKVLFALVFGALIGSFIALRINYHFCWLGVIVGGLAGYLSYEYRTVGIALAEGWDEFTTAMAECDWSLPQPNWEKWKSLSQMWAISTLLIAAGFAGLYVLDPFWQAPKSYLANDIFTFLNAACGCSAVTGVMVALMSVDGHGKPLEQRLAKAKWMLRNTNPVGAILLTFSWGYIAVKFAVLLLLGIAAEVYDRRKKIANAMASFFVTVFRTIHCETRLLCGFHAALGSAVGYYSHSILIGVATAAVTGLFSYEVTAKRILKVVPR